MTTTNSDTEVSLQNAGEARIPAVVTPLDEHMGLDIARSLGRQGIPVFGIDPDPKAVGGKSKYCRLVVCPDPKKAAEEYVQFLVDWGKGLGGTLSAMMWRCFVRVNAQGYSHIMSL